MRRHLWERVIPRCGKEDYGQSWSSHEWKSEAAEHDRSGKPETTSWNTLQRVVHHREDSSRTENARSVRYGERRSTMDQGNLRQLTPKKGLIPKLSSWESDVAEFVNKVKDQVRSRQKRMSNVAESGEEHSIIW